jgi:hypothetical protein
MTMFRRVVRSQAAGRVAATTERSDHRLCLVKPFPTINGPNNDREFDFHEPGCCAAVWLQESGDDKTAVAETGT